MDEPYTEVSSGNVDGVIDNEACKDLLMMPGVLGGVDGGGRADALVLASLAARSRTKVAMVSCCCCCRSCCGGAPEQLCSARVPMGTIAWWHRAAKTAWKIFKPF